MTQKVWVISDTHFGQTAILTFKNDKGEPIRPFSSIEEMHTTMIANWNSVVKKDDLVLHLGDVAFSGQAFDEIMPQLNGNKYLIRGNHDRFTEGRYRRHFRRILGVYVRDNYAFTHVPIHPSCLTRWKGNIHGHLHDNTVGSPKYFNASVERINFTPRSFEDIKRNYFYDIEG